MYVIQNCISDTETALKMDVYGLDIDNKLKGKPNYYLLYIECP